MQEQTSRPNSLSLQENEKDNMVNNNPSAIDEVRHAAVLDGNTLELLAERPQVNVERLVTGNVRLTKQVKTQTVNVPVTLTQEVLVIDYVTNPRTTDNQQDLVTVTPTNSQPATIMVNGQAINLTDAPHEIVLSQQVANVAIETVVTEKVAISTTSTSHEEQVPVTLRHEELVTEEIKVDNPTVLATTRVEADKFQVR